jgi:hypothetical protein
MREGEGGKENEGSEKERTDGDGRKVTVGRIKEASEKELKMHGKEVEGKVRGCGKSEGSKG